jgi:hypothetical protein
MYREILAHHEKLNSLNFRDYSQMRSNILSRVCKDLHRQARAKSRRVHQLAETEIFLDVPLESREQVSGLYVLLGDAASPEITHFHRHSPMDEAIADAFRVWSRRVRVFISPERWRQYVDLFGRRPLEELAFTALHRAYVEELGGGYPLPLPGLQDLAGVA